jgi:hypothetical protein
VTCLPPQWLVDAVAVQLSGFTTRSLAGDLGRQPRTFKSWPKLSGYLPALRALALLCFLVI